MAEKGGQKTVERKVGRPRAEKVYKQFEKHGGITVFIGSILPPPFPFTSALMAAGIMQYPRVKFFSALTAGRALRFFAVAYLGGVYGQRIIAFFSQYYYPVLYGLIALAVTLGIGALIYFRWYRPTAQREKHTRSEQAAEFPGRHMKDTDSGSPRKFGRTRHE